VSTHSSEAKEIAIIINKKGAEQAPVVATVLKEGTERFEFDLPLGLPIGIGITHFVERAGKGRVGINIVELGHRTEGQTAIYQYVAYYAD
jgi:hypothetical protein